MRVGTLVSSRSHVDLLCRIDPPHGMLAFGDFVRVGETAVGLVASSQIMSPEFGGGPAATLVSVLLLGSLTESGGRQEIPRDIVPLQAEVRRMPDEAIARFHQDPVAGLQVRYAPLILSQAGGMAAPLLVSLLDRLSELFPDDRPRLAVLRKAVRWQSAMTALHG